MSPTGRTPRTHESRWAVILVRLPSDPTALNDVLPRSRPVQPEELPLVTRVTRDLVKAHDTAVRLREVGAQVVVVEEPIERGLSAFCVQHPAQLAARTCEVCSVAICPGCMVDSGGEPLCASCRIEKETRTSRIRRRKLFVALLFFAFLYQVVDYLRLDAQKIEKGNPIRIGIMQFAPKSDLGATIIRQLNQGPTEKRTGTSIRDLGPWFDAEYRRYSGLQGRYVEVETRGPFAVDVHPPALARPEDSWFNIMFRAWRYPRYFRQLAEDHGLPVDDYAVKVYVVYGGEQGDLANHSRGSKKGRIAVVFVSLDEANPAYALATMVHEIGHALGASDTYDPDTSRAQHPEGFVEPFANPLYPQRYAELMNVDIPVSSNTELEVRRIDQLRVGYRTASEMGWIGPEQARVFYTPPEISPADRLDLPEAADP